MLETYNLFRKEAIRNPKLVELGDEDTKRIQQVLLDTLTDFDEVCRKYHLQYALVGGSALGAVRHHGFIPWDDDLDVCMPRRDYVRIKALFESEFSRKYWVQSHEDGSGYDLNFMKIRRKGSRYLEIFDPVEEQSGIFMDVYCMENTFDAWLPRTVQGLLCDLLLLCTSCARIYRKKERILSFITTPAVHRVTKVKAGIGWLLSFRSPAQWCSLLEKCAGMCKNDASKRITVPAGRRHFFGELYDRDVFFPAQDVEFEGKNFRVVGNTEDYLSHFFGDYMRIPPENEREVHVVREFRLPEKKAAP